MAAPATVPRISAPSLAEHVRHQRDAILDAAAALFVAHGFTHTDYAEIAGAVGLARNSLYRYFGSKEDILVAWFERELEPARAHTREILALDAPAVERIEHWIDYQLGLSAEHEHGIGNQLIREVGVLGRDAQAAIGEGHERLVAMLQPAVAEVLAARGRTERDPALVTRLIGAVVTETFRYVVRTGDLAAARAEAIATSRRILEG